MAKDPDGAKAHPEPSVMTGTDTQYLGTFPLLIKDIELEY